MLTKLKQIKKFAFKLVCQYSKLEKTYSIEHLADLKMARLDELKQIVINDLNDVIFIETCKL